MKHLLLVALLAGLASCGQSPDGTESEAVRRGIERSVADVQAAEAATAAAAPESMPANPAGRTRS